MARVARGRIVLLTWDPAAGDFWLATDYFPEIVEMDRPVFPTMACGFGFLEVYLASSRRWTPSTAILAETQI
jgi:hypothetical protein